MSIAPIQGRLHELRPDQLEALIDSAPVAYWPLGLIEHHGWALPVGYDGIKAERLCLRMAARTGGAVLPVMWWGGGGGHGQFKWTFYQPMEVPSRALETTARQLLEFGFRCVVVVAGHYPWRGVMNEVLPPVAEAYPDRLLLWGTEPELAPPEAGMRGDHAARWETAYGLSLLPEFIDMGAFEADRDTGRAWPPGGPPPKTERSTRGCYDAADPLFAQFGEDARKASKAEADALLDQVVEHTTAKVMAKLG